MEPERETETDRQTDRQTDRDRETMERGKTERGGVRELRGRTERDGVRERKEVRHGEGGGGERRITKRDVEEGEGREKVGNGRERRRR